MKELLLAPLGMERATFRPTEAMTRPISQGHEVPQEGPGTLVRVVRPFSDDSRQWPNGFLLASAYALFLEQFGGHFPVTRLGVDLFSAQPPGGRPAIPFRLIAGAGGRGELLQMFLWVFRKEEAAP